MAADHPTSPPAPSRTADALVVGAGIAGLTAAFRLRGAGLRVTVLEAGSEPGGAIATVRVNGHLFERGPNTVLSSAPSLAELIDDAGLRARAVESRPMAGRRLVWRHGRLHALPEKPPHLLRCTALSPLGRLRLLLEPLVPGRKTEGGAAADETLESFFRRRLGAEATAGLADPFVTGVFAGRLDRLGVDAFPRLAQLEREHGSLLKGLLRTRKAQRAKKEGGELTEDGTLRSGPAPLISFPEGLQQLPRTLAAELDDGEGSGVLYGQRATSVERRSGHWRVRCTTGNAEEVVHAGTLLVLATPARTAAELLDGPLDGNGHAMGFLLELEHPHVATVGLGFRRAQVAHPLDAFGLLVASDSRLAHDVLGVLFPSSIFPGRAPAGEVNLVVMAGGSRDPKAAELGENELVERVRAALATLVQAEGEPTACCVSRWPRAIPQYPPGHLRRVEALRQQLARMPGLAVAGNWLEGVGLEGAVASGAAAARQLLKTSPIPRTP
ncbi:MAG: protoporphyrinogen oxidase [Holophagales bacterium]|nr:protoporphyrinogen oxidase [Holophagales bacterium]